MKMRQVDKTEFWCAVGPQDCHPKIMGKYPYTSLFLTPDGTLVGKIVNTETRNEDGKVMYPAASEYLLPDED